ncbi:MAG TPA: PDZ domain-containing protein, partial [Kofleriaceae bacterium]|nr:PDZ domain-containing protein [Kofleriaceae bacterium]
TYSVHVRAADGSEITQRDVAAGTRTLAIHLARAGALDGTLVGFAQPPRVVIDRQTNDPHGIADATVDGTAFSRAGLSPGTYTVHATAGGDVAAASVEVHAGETAHVQLTSRGSSRIEGMVQEFGSRAPVAGFRCDALLVVGARPVMMPPDETQQTFTGLDGHFSLSAPVGRVRVMCFAPTGGPLTPAGTDVDVVANGLAHANVLSVRASDAPPATIGLGLTPFVLPLTVEGVAPSGPAAAAGVRAGDHVVAIDGAPLDGVLPAGAAALIGNHRPGTTITLAIERAGSTQTVKIALPAR